MDVLAPQKYPLQSPNTLPDVSTTDAWKVLLCRSRYPLSRAVLYRVGRTVCRLLSVAVMVMLKPAKSSFSYGEEGNGKTLP